MKIRAAMLKFALPLMMVAASPASPAPLPVHIGGRTIAAPDGSLSFGWPGVYIESAFRGTSVRVAFDAPQDHLRLLIDGKPVRTFYKPGVVDMVIDGLTGSAHVVRLEKLTESQQGGSRFIGFYPVGATTALPIRHAARAIEFIGDSYTVGYGDTSKTTICSESEVHDRTDTQAAFGPIVARHYGADYRINAYSGIGMVRNYAGSSAGSSLPTIYPRAKPDEAALLDDAHDWRPQVIVVNLGTNDFSTPLKAGERWPTDAALHDAYRARYVAFVRERMTAQPLARFVLMGSAMFYPDVAAVAATLGAPRGRVTTVPFDGLALTACKGHPSLADHRKLAVLVEHALDAMTGVWG